MISSTLQSSALHIADRVEKRIAFALLFFSIERLARVIPTRSASSPRDIFLFAIIMLKIQGLPANLISMGSLDFGLLLEGTLVIVETVFVALAGLSHRVGPERFAKMSKLGVIKKSGSWFSYGDRKLMQGRDATKDLLMQDHELRSEIEEKVRAALKSSNQQN